MSRPTVSPVPLILRPAWQRGLGLSLVAAGALIELGRLGHALAAA